MALITGSNVTAAQFIAALNTAVAANGWTVNKYATGISNDGFTGDELYVSKGDIYGVFRSRPLYSNASGIGLMAAQGFNTGLAWNQQPGWASISGRKSPAPAACSAWSGHFEGTSNTVLNYWIIIHTNPDTIWVIFEHMAGWYSYLGLGAIKKIGDWVGGTFQTGSFNQQPHGTVGPLYQSWPTYERMNITYMPTPPLGYNTYSYSGAGCSTLLANLEGTLEWLNFNHEQTNARRGASATPGGLGTTVTAMANIGVPNYAGFGHHISCPHAPSPTYEFIGPILSPFGGVVPLLPWYVYGERGALASRQYIFSLLGVIDKIYYTNITNLAPATQIEQGGDTYMVFPIIRKGAQQYGTSASNSYAHMNCATGNAGWAIKVT